MATTPRTQHTKSGGLHIAYQVTGGGPLDLIVVPGFVSHLEYQWEHPWSAREKVGGIAVHIGTRVAGLAKPGEVLVSNTVKDLVAGSGIGFEERGAHILKGVPGEWRLFAVAPAA
jgi:hypothetical protein